MNARELRFRDVERLTPVQISTLMSRDAVSAAPDMSVEGLTWLLLERGLCAVPVITEDGKLVGVVSTADLLNEVQDRGDTEERVLLRMHRRRGVQMEIGDGFHVTCLARATVEEIMTPLAVTLPETASITQAAAMMSSRGLSQLPVVSSRGRVVGMLTALDVVRWLAKDATVDREMPDREVSSASEIPEGPGSCWMSVGSGNRGFVSPLIRG